MICVRGLVWLRGVMAEVSPALGGMKVGGRSCHEVFNGFLAGACVVLLAGTPLKSMRRSAPASFGTAKAPEVILGGVVSEAKVRPEPHRHKRRMTPRHSRWLAAK